MRNVEDFVVVPCDCGSLDHAVIFCASNFKGRDISLLIRFPLYTKTLSPLRRIKNVLKRRFEFTFNMTVDALYFPLIEYFWRISFPGKTFEYSVLENHPHWKLYLMESKLTLKLRHMSLDQVVYYLRYGVLEYPFEIFIDEEGPSGASYEIIY
jgi:hypothetical protein